MLILPSREVAMEGAKMGGGGICNLNPKTCGAAQTLSGQVKEMMKRKNKGRG